MGIKGWVRRMMETDDGHDTPSDDVVQVANVHIAMSMIVVSELEAVGIRAEAVEQRAGYGGPVRTRILCFARDRDAATEIIDRIFADPESPDWKP